MSAPVFKRILLKISGAALAADKGFGVDTARIHEVAAELADVHNLGIQMAIVVGGGNFFRGVADQPKDMDRVSADHMGMLATVINALALQDALEKQNVFTRVQTAIEMNQVAEPFIRRRAIRHLEKGRIVIFAAGTSNPYFSTDTAATLRALEIKAEIIAKGTRIAAEALEAAEADIVFADGDFVVSGTDRRIGLGDVAALARAAGTPLDTYHFWTRQWMTFPNGTHVAEVEIDPETGAVVLTRYSAVDDYGVLVNPMIAAGQAHGAIATGVGQALLEQAAYDPDSGQMIAASFMDYALPRADDLPAFSLGFNPTRCTTNPLGVKGCGEAGAIAAFPAIHNAIHDALAAVGGKMFDGPATPARVWQAMRDSRR